MSQPLAISGIFMCPIFKNGKVLRITLPRAVARTLRVGRGDIVTFTMAVDGRVFVEKLNVEAMKHAHLSNRPAQLTLSAGNPATPRDGEG